MKNGFIRKRNRIQDYDYSSNGVYYLTICAEDKACLFADPKTLAISAIGETVKQATEQIAYRYMGVKLVKYVIMPNHVHLMIELHGTSANIPRIVSQYKRYVSMRAGRRVWQKSYYDHVVRDESDFQRIWEYIDTNEAKWAEDRYYVPC